MPTCAERRVGSFGDPRDALLGRTLREEQLDERSGHQRRTDLQPGAGRYPPPMPQPKLQAEVRGETPGAPGAAEIGKDDQRSADLCTDGDEDAKRGNLGCAAGRQ